MQSLQDHGGLPHPVADARFYSGVPLRRLLAFLLDTAAILLLGILAGGIVGLVTLGVGFALFVPVMGLTGLAYRIASLARWSATPGMRVTGIELRRFDGDRFDGRDAVLHTLAFTVCVMLGITQLVSIAMMAFAPMGRGLPDLLLGSAAINSPV